MNLPQGRPGTLATADGLGKVRNELKELGLLFEISQILDRSLDLREVVGPVLDAVSKQMGMVRGTLTLLNRQTGEIFIDAAHGLSDSQKERGRYRLGEGVTGKVIQTGTFEELMAQDGLFREMAQRQLA